MIDGYLIILEKDKNELYEHTISRGIFIAKQKPKTIEEYNHALVYSRIYNNIKFNKCAYNQKVMNELEKFIL